MKNKNSIKKAAIVLLQISILVISIIAFSNIVSAQVSIAPVSTSFGKKVMIYNNQSYATNGNKGSPITGHFGEEITWFSAPLLGKIGEGAGGLLKSFLPTEGFTMSAFMWTGVIYLGVLLALKIADAFGANVSPDVYMWINALGTAALAGQAAGSLAVGLAQGLGWTAAVPWIGWAVGAAVVIVTFFLMMLRVDQRAVIINCAPWSSKTGGSDCGLCNGKQFPCTLYQCKSLGESCELKNEGPKAVCVYNNSGDVNPPTIKPRIDSLSSTEYSYDPIAGVNGVEIKYRNGDVPNSQSFTFGIELDKVGTCRIEPQRTANFSSMKVPFGSGDWQYNHTQVMYFPAEDNKTGIQIPNGGTFDYYVRCQSVNGASNVAEYLFRIKILTIPDPSPPNILGFSLLDNTPIKYFGTSDAHEINIKAYVNKPSQCKWSQTDKDYDKMENSMSCVTAPDGFTTFRGQVAYACSGRLTGLENEKNNNFYFRCQDVATEHANTISKSLTLVGSRPLVLDSAGPSGITVKGSTNSVRVTLQASTSAGVNNGMATCQYSTTGEAGSYKNFDNTNSHTHSSDLSLTAGGKTYYLQCFDAAGNMVQQNIQFTVETDTSAPAAVRIFKDSNSLKIITDEKSQCVYDTESCDYNFADGLKMTDSGDGITHETGWNTADKYYIKCKDDYGNQPQPRNTCTVTVRPLQL